MDRKELKEKLVPFAKRSLHPGYIAKSRENQFSDAMSHILDLFAESKIEEAREEITLAINNAVEHLLLNNTGTIVYDNTDTLEFIAGKSYYLKPGVYTLEETLTVPDNCVIIGAGATTVLSLAGATTCVTFSGDGALLGYLKLLGASTADSVGIALSGDNNKIENLIIDLYPDAIVVTGSGNVINAFISNATTTGISIGTGTENVVKESKFTENGVGVFVDSSFNQILNSTFIDNTTGIELAATASGVCNSVIGNSIIRGTGEAQDYGVGDNTIL